MPSRAGRKGITVREALEMPAFAEAAPVAGRDGLDRVIEWAHIVDIPHASYAWDRPGVLLLTTGYGLPEDADAQRTLVPQLVEHGFAGLVLSTGYLFDRAPEALREAADAHGLPVIETPADMLFIELTEAIFSQLVNRQYALLQHSNRMHTQLTGLALRGAGLEAVASTLAELLRRSVTIEDPSLRVLATASSGAVDDARERSVGEGRATPEISERLLTGGLYDRLLEEMGPVHVPPEPDLGMTMERIVAPIIVDREIHGYIWVIAGDAPLTDVDTMAITHGATVAALILLRDQAAREAEVSLRGDLLERLVATGSDPAVLAEQAHRLGIRLDRPLQVLLVQATSQVQADPRLAVGDVETWLRRHGIDALAVWRHETLVVLLHAEAAGRGREVAGRLVADLSHPARRLLVGVGDPAEPAADGGPTVRRSYDQAREAFRIREAMGQRGGVAAFADLGLLHWLNHLPPQILEGNAYLAAVRRLAAIDAERESDLLTTLESYLDHGGAVVATAGALFIHRNTLLHRLDRIAEHTSLDLRDPPTALQLHAAIKCHRLMVGTAGPAS